MVEGVILASIRFLFVLFFFSLKLSLFGDYYALDPYSPKYLWMDEQIEREFAPFRDGITNEMLAETERLCPLYHRYKIKNSEIFGPEGAVKQMLNRLVLLYLVPDVEFLYLQSDGIIKVEEDWPVQLADKNFHPEVFPGPVFTSTKDKRCDRAILFLEWNLYLKGAHASNWPILFKEILSLSEQTSWEKKTSKLFWRGYPMGFQHDYSHNWKNTPRGKACYLSHLYPDLINAGFNVTDHTFIVNAQQIENINIYKPWVDQPDVMKYKYQLSIDGHTCSYPGLQWKLLSKCTVFLQETEDVMWFYSQIHPWVHYIPVKKDLSDLKEKVVWAQLNDRASREIANNSHEFAKEQLHPEAILLYCYKVLCKYASLQRL